MKLTRIITISTLFFIATLLQLCMNSVLATPIIAENSYPTQPNEVLPIQPVQLYPKLRGYRINGRKLEKDNEVIYVKLLKRKGYRPKKQQIKTLSKNKKPEPKPKDIFYVKALANGQFSTHRVKWYRLPEFYAISVFRKGEVSPPK